MIAYLKGVLASTGIDSAVVDVGGVGYVFGASSRTLAALGRAVLDGLILPRVAEVRPPVLVLQCGADSLLEDPLSRLALSNRAYLEAVAALLPLAPRVLVLGGGGYNPWSVGRLWTAIWGLLAGQELPDRLPPDAQAVLQGLGWGGGGRPVPEGHLLTSLLDPPREGPVRPDIRDRLAILRAR